MLALRGGGVLGARVEPTALSELAPDFDERLVVERARSGDQEALGDLYSFYFPRVYRYVAGRVWSTEDAEDVTEEIFLRVVANLKRFQWRGLPFGAWIFRIARNEVVSHARRQQRRGAPAPLSDTIPDARQDHVAAYEQEVTLELVRDASARLPAAQRDVIAMRFGAGLSVAETASTLGKTENNVKVLQHKAVARLRRTVRRD